MFQAIEHICFQAFIVTGLFWQHAGAQPFSFRKVNSGTKSDIRAITRNNKGKIALFYPVSDRDILFSVDQVTSTSMLYHYLGGMTASIRPP